MSDPKPAIMRIYEAVNEVIGGNNPDEQLCMTMPGTIINPQDYHYDTRFQKPFKVQANESRLVNKLFDPVKITGSDNGRQLSTQFKSALNALTPKLNASLAEAKNELRQILSMPTSYTLDDGTKITLSFQQLFYKLYEEYVEEKKKWAQLQNEKREELLQKYPDDSDNDKYKREEEFLNWYQTVAEANLLKVNMKHGKVLGIFSDNDMKIIEGILDSGSGAELQEAREQVTNARKFDPDGGYIYPVSMEPSDWFSSLESDFSFIDLLETSDHYADKYAVALKKRNALSRQIQLFENKDKSSEIGKLVDELKTAQTNLDAVTSELDKIYGEGFSTGVNMIQTLISKVQNSIDKEKLQTDTKEYAKNNGISDTENDSFNIDVILDNINKMDEAQRKYDKAAIEVSSCSQRLIDAKTNNYTVELKSLYEQLKEANDTLDSLKTSLENALKKEQGNLNEELFPNAIAGRYMQVNISISGSDMKQTSDDTSSASQSSTGVSFLFGGYHSSSDDAQASASAMLDDEEFQMDIGLLATKVSFTRNWFNPGVFLLSEDMYHTTSNRISLGSFENKEQSKCLFPCYPTSMVIAKDVSIQITMSEEHMSSFKSMSEHHASKGGGFLCFKTAKSSSSQESHSSYSMSQKGNSVTIKIPGPQIFGYYLETVPEDKSAPYQDNSDQQAMNETITQFVETYRKLLSDQSAS